ncbi:MAG: IS4 family transposase [Verrucomicrobia bacterium]|nr:IS4 family transposase [Deltaproteobacteria bacterium]
MPRQLNPFAKLKAPFSFARLFKPALDTVSLVTPLVSRSNRPMTFTFEHHLKALVYLHLHEYESGRELLQVMEQDDFARSHIAPPEGVSRSAFFEAMNTRALEQLSEMYHLLQAKAKKLLPVLHPHLGNLVAIDGSLIDSVASMQWADYRDGSKKAKVHLGFDLNRSIPEKIFLSAGKADERPFVSKILEPGQTGVMDRYYQCHKNFDEWQTEEKHFVCRIRKGTRKTVVEEHTTPEGSHIFLDVRALLGTANQNQTEKPVRVVGYEVDNNEYYVATDRFDLSAEDVALVYKLRWDIEKFFGWWKQHLNVYHLIARSPKGLMAQILGGLITYLLLAIYCHEEHNERVSINRVRELRIKIRNELAEMSVELDESDAIANKPNGPPSHASP